MPRIFPRLWWLPVCSKGAPLDGEPCPLCLRTLPLTFHHLVPVSLRRRRQVRARFSPEELREGVLLCRDCHSAVHHFVPNKELAARRYGLEELRAVPELAKWVVWARRQKGRIRFG